MRLRAVIFTTSVLAALFLHLFGGKQPVQAAIQCGYPTGEMWQVSSELSCCDGLCPTNRYLYVGNPDDKIFQDCTEETSGFCNDKTDFPCITQICDETWCDLVPPKCSWHDLDPSPPLEYWPGCQMNPEVTCRPWDPCQ